MEFSSFVEEALYIDGEKQQKIVSLVFFLHSYKIATGTGKALFLIKEYRSGELMTIFEKVFHLQEAAKVLKEESKSCR